MKAESYERIEKGIIKRGRHFYVSAQNGPTRVRVIALLPDSSPCRTVVQARAALAILKGQVREGRHIPADKRRMTIGDILDSLKAHLDAFITAYNFAKHLKSLRWRTPFQIICDAWTKDPTPFIINPHHLIPGPHT